MQSWTVQWMAFNSIIFIIAVFVQWQLVLEHPEAHSRYLRKMSFAKFICMGCKARMYLERLLPASSNKANVLSGNPFGSQTEIFFASYELLGLENKGEFWIKLGTQTDLITTKQFGSHLLFIFDRHYFLHGEALWLSELCKSQCCFSVSDDNDVCYTSVSGFVFLRFFAPAILNPKLFQMRNEHAVSNIWPFLKDWNK